MTTVVEADAAPAATGRLGAIELVLFDCDGVLIDSEPIASATLAETMRAMGAVISDGRAHALFTGNAVPVILRMIADEFPWIDPAVLKTRWRQVLYEAFADRLRPMVGMAEVVAGIDRPICVASNSNMERLRLSLGRLDLWRAFDPNVFSAEMVANPKPAPDLLLYCAQRIGAAPARCVMIDDSPHGIEAAVQAGMLAIGFVDPNDIRPAREQVLAAAGAHVVVRGAAALPGALAEVDAVLARAARNAD